MELATSEAGTKIAAWRALLEKRPDDLADRLGIIEREQLEPLVDLLQKWAFDQAAGSFGVPGRYGFSERQGTSRVEPRRWLEFARRLGRARVEARHPVNPKLFLAELVAGMP